MENKYSHHNDFALYNPVTGKTKRLSEFGGVIINTEDSYYERECMPDVSHITDNSDMRDGEIYVNSKVQPRTIEFTVFLSYEFGNDGDLEEFKGWLFGNRGYQRLSYPEDENETEATEKTIWVAYAGGCPSQVYYGSAKRFNGKMKLKFVAYDPYWRMRNNVDIIFSEENKTPLILGETTDLAKTMGNCDCYPLITIIPNSSKVTFTWNDLTVKLTNLEIGKEFYIDCELEQAYTLDSKGKKELTLKNFKTNEYWDFPILRYDMENEITLNEGSVKSFIISPNCRVI